MSKDNELQYSVEHQKNVRLHLESLNAQSLGQYCSTNDLPTGVKTSKVACFAYDTKVLKQIDNLQDNVFKMTSTTLINGWATDLTINGT